MTFDDLWGKLVSIRRGPGTFVSQAELAWRMGTAQTHVSELESGYHIPSVDILERYANALGYVVTYDLKRVEEME